MPTRFSDAIQKALEDELHASEANYSELSKQERDAIPLPSFASFSALVTATKTLAASVSKELDVIDEKLRFARPTLEDVQIEQDPDDHRKLTRIETWSDGRKFVARLRNDAPLFIGTHERGKSYRRGDWVVMNGSTWACVKDTSDSPGTNSPSWLIVARKGSDANRG